MLYVCVGCQSSWTQPSLHPDERRNVFKKQEEVQSPLFQAPQMTDGALSFNNDCI